MSPENFCFWLQGYFELGGENLSPQQVQIIKDHLALVFNKVTPNYNLGSIFPPKTQDYCNPVKQANNLFTYSVWDNDKWKASDQMPPMTGIPVDFSTALEDYKNDDLSKHGTIGYISGPNGGMISTSEFKNFMENTNSGQNVPETYPFVAFNKSVDFPVYPINGGGISFSQKFGGDYGEEQRFYGYSPNSQMYPPPSNQQMITC